MVGIDFTASNRPTSVPTSLHFLSARRPNDYQRTLGRALSILEPYDADQQIAAFGFGGCVPPRMQISHAFPLSLDPAQVELPGMRGVLEAHKSALPQVRLSGPTLFAPIIAEAMAVARECTDGNLYVFLLLLTDGEINDMRRTTDLMWRPPTRCR